jgi:3',5'-cyclic AMP phosphodiesterase CpdA
MDSPRAPSDDALELIERLLRRSTSDTDDSRVFVRGLSDESTNESKTNASAGALRCQFSLQDSYGVRQSRAGSQ